MIMGRPTEYKIFDGERYKYAGFTWSEKGVERRRRFWKRLGYKMRSIKRTKEHLPLPAGYKAKYILYARKR